MRTPGPIQSPLNRIEVSLREVEEALPRVREVAWRTPTVPFEDGVYLKLENLQRLGVFKIRGTWNRLSRLSEAECRHGVATISSGNHGLSLAWAAKRLGIPCLVKVPEGAVARKVDAIRSYGAQVEPMPRALLVLFHEEERWREWPQTFIHPFAHPHTIAGAGTIGLEIAEEVPDARTVIVPVGGGGLVSGIAIAVKGRLPKAKVYGVQAEGAAPLPEALRTGRPGRIENPNTIADGIRVAVILPDMLELFRRHLDGCLVVSDDEIRAAMRTLAVDAKTVAEPAGAAAFAAWRRYRRDLEPPVAVVVSGGNADPAILQQILG